MCRRHPHGRTALADVSGVDVPAIRAAIEKSLNSPVPWQMYGRGDNQISSTDDAFGHVGSTTFMADAELIVLLRNNAEALLDIVEKCNGHRWVQVTDEDLDW